MKESQSNVQTTIKARKKKHIYFHPLYRRIITSRTITDTVIIEEKN